MEGLTGPQVRSESINQLVSQSVTFHSGLSNQDYCMIYQSASANNRTGQFSADAGRGTE